jgi:transposase-like protein
METQNSKQSALYERMESHLKLKKPLLGKDSPFSELLQGMVNKILEGEVNQFIEDEKKEGKSNKRNGYTKKKVLSSTGQIEVSTPRDRAGEFEPELIGKRERELTSGLDEHIMAFYAQGNSIEDIRRLLQQMYGIEISSGKISQITDSILPEIESWRNRPLESFYPIVYLDAIIFKVRQEGIYVNRAFYTAYSVSWEGQRDLLGIYVNRTEGASRWGLVLEDLKKRGVEDILVVCTDNLKGFTEVIQEVYPHAITQKCVVHQVRNSLKYVEEKDIKSVASDLRKIYTCSTLEQAQMSMEVFENQWGKTYGYIVKQWRQEWEEIMAFMNFNQPMRRMIYTTNPVEALHRIIRKSIKAKAAWVSETALVKQIYLTLKHNEKSWKRSAFGWRSIQRDLLEKYPERIKKQD